MKEPAGRLEPEFSVGPETAAVSSTGGETAQVGAAKARLRSAALTLFAERGFRSTSVRDVMRACDLTAGALYAHYPSKESLLFDLIKEGHVRLERLLGSVARVPAPTSPSRFAALVYYHVLFTLRNVRLARVANSSLNALPPEMAAEIADLRATLNRYFADSYQEAVGEGWFDPTHPEIVLLATLAATNQLTDWFRDDGPMSPEEMARWHAVMALRIAVAGRIDSESIDRLVDVGIQSEHIVDSVAS